MGASEFAMVEELASLIKNNLECKHLILSMEESFINFIQDETSSDKKLELEPMNGYCRLLLHRLADIFGFTHYSLGEGKERHLVLELCPETTIPCILVRDLLVQYDELEPPTVLHQLLRKSDDSSLPRTVAVTPDVKFSLEKREEAYMAARKRIFSKHKDGEEKDVCEKQRPRNVPVVANRMIAHALGRQFKDSVNISRNSYDGKTVSEGVDDNLKIDDGKTVSEGVDENLKIDNGKNDDHVEAARRLFANALGVRSKNVN